MADVKRADVWAIGEAYELYVGRWSRLVAEAFIGWLSLPRGQRWLDVGCGTGALSQVILERADPGQVTGVDLSEGFLRFARGRVADPRATFRAGDARDLASQDGAFDCAVSGLALNFVPEPALAVREMTRSTRAGGTVAAYVWDYAGEMQMMRRFWDAAVALDSAADVLDEGRRFPLCRPQPFADLFSRAGLRNVVTRALDVPTAFSNFDDYWAPFLGGQGPAPGYCGSLTDERRAVLRERLRSTLPTEADGRIALTARAWAVRGVVGA